ncbi:uncharacterized protein LOC129952561 [Eupeodes corollae]|uniref:uncharacterized protein LOC129952561 n=1 Tax=Eupeodes corollae TaxID=290404 RepID=UPI0024929A54|nr:uncharacterized protein LOC129952561 [Eupeodes corollae]
MLKNYLFNFNRFENIFLLWFLILIKLNSINGHDHFYLDSHRTEKQMSLESCLGRFDVHGNTIIRTGESQAIGGKFLQGLELETPEKCQRLCCETTDCDVYVFEEKNDGYCYLFQCGSPKNFHCKFTRHSNYTSALLTQFKAVLTTTPRPNTHIVLTNISTQEQELISLKAKPERYLVSSTTQTIVPSGGNDNALMPAEPVERRNFSCGRFEFPCHSGECIAVYNACNGIPQCVDGSDEGPECSDATSNKVNPNIHEISKSNIIHETPIYRQNFKKIDKMPIDESPILENAHPMGIKEIENNNFALINDGTRTFLRNNDGKEENVNLERPGSKLIQNQREMYMQLPDIKSSFPTPQVTGEKAHIFNENSKWPTEQRQLYNIVTHEPPFSNLDQQLINKAGKNHKSFVPENDEKLSDNSRLFNQDAQAKPSLPNNTHFVEKNLEYADYSEKTIDSVKKDITPKKDELSRTSTSVKKATHPAFVEQYKVMQQHLEIKFTDHDGYSEKPRGAVLSLTLGLMVTGIIIVLIGCRLRTGSRRRNRHGGKVPYAPDEDFLVNGMYL